MVSQATLLTPLDVAAQVDPDVRRDVFFEDDEFVNVGRLSAETGQSFGRWGYDSGSNEVRLEGLFDGAGTQPDLTVRVGDIAGTITTMVRIEGASLEIGLNFISGNTTFAPISAIHLQNEGSQPEITLDNYSGGGADNWMLNFRRAQGTLAAPAALTDDNDILGMFAIGFDGAGFFEGGEFLAEAADAWSGTSHGVRWVFKTTATGSTAGSTNRVVISSEGALIVGGSQTPDSTELLNVEGQAIIDDNVSIGTTVFLAKLAVVGDTVGENTLIARSVAGQTADLLRLESSTSVPLVNVGGQADTATFFTIAPPAFSGGAHPTAFFITAAAHGTATATAHSDVTFGLARTVQFTAGAAISTADGVVITPPTFAATAAQTITDAATVRISGVPGTGLNVTYTNGPFALDVTGATRVTGKLTVTGAIDPTELLLSGGGTAHFFESNDGSTAPVSGGATGRLIYDDTIPAWRVSVQGGAYATLSTAAASPWQTTATVTNLVTAGDSVTVGSAVNLGKFAVDGDTAAEIQAVIQGAAAQSAELLQLQDSAATRLAGFTSTGKLFIGTTAGIGSDEQVVAQGTANDISSIEVFNFETDTAAGAEFTAANDSTSIIRMGTLSSGFTGTLLTLIDADDTYILSSSGDVGAKLVINHSADEPILIGTFDEARVEIHEDAVGGGITVENGGAATSLTRAGFVSIIGASDENQLVVRAVAGQSAATLLVETSASAVRLASDDNGVGIGLTTIGVTSVTSGVGVLHIANAGTNPAGTIPSSGAILYCTAGELHVLDAAGNDTLLSPHHPRSNEWVFYSKNTRTGRVLRIRVEAAMKALDELLGGGYFEEAFEEVA